MKRMIALALSLALSLCACSTSSQIPTLGEIVENNAEIEHITVTSLEEGSSADDEQQTAPAVQVAQVGGSDFGLSAEDAETVLQILDTGSWIPDATKCDSDYVVTLQGRRSTTTPTAAHLMSNWSSLTRVCVYLMPSGKR